MFFILTRRHWFYCTLFYGTDRQFSLSVCVMSCQKFILKVQLDAYSIIFTLFLPIHSTRLVFLLHTASALVVSLLDGRSGELERVLFAILVVIDLIMHILLSCEILIYGFLLVAAITDQYYLLLV